MPIDKEKARKFKQGWFPRNTNGNTQAPQEVAKQVTHIATPQNPQPYEMPNPQTRQRLQPVRHIENNQQPQPYVGGQRRNAYTQGNGAGMQGDERQDATNPQKPKPQYIISDDELPMNRW